MQFLTINILSTVSKIIRVQKYNQFFKLNAGLTIFILLKPSLCYYEFLYIYCINRFVGKERAHSAFEMCYLLCHSNFLIAREWYFIRTNKIFIFINVYL